MRSQNWTVNDAVRWAVSGAVSGALWQTVAVAGDRAVGEAVYWAVRGAVHGAVLQSLNDPSHPAFADFLWEAELEPC